MAKKFDYQMKTITIDEAMEILGFANVGSFVVAQAKHLPSHEISGEVDMFSMAEIRSMANALGRVAEIPDEIRSRSIMYEEDIPVVEKEEEPPAKRLEHPYMEGPKCLESCFHKDDYGFCKCGSKCIVYDVELAPQKTVVEVVNDRIERERAMAYEKKREVAENVYSDGSAKISAVQDILMKQLYAMTAPNLTQDEREVAIKTGLAVSNVSKTVLTSFGLQMHSFELATMYGIDKKGVKKLI